jgi:hypothetical protein
MTITVMSTVKGETDHATRRMEWNADGRLPMATWFGLFGTFY